MLHFATLLVNWVVLHKDALLSLVGGAAGLSVIAQGLLHKIHVKWGISSKAFAYTLVQVLTVAATLSAYLVNGNNSLVVYPWLATLAAVVHRYAVSPYYTKKVLPYLTFLSENAVQTTTPYEVPVAAPAEAQVPAFVS